MKNDIIYEHLTPAQTQNLEDCDPETRTDVLNFIHDLINKGMRVKSAVYMAFSAWGI
jgi:hypothetical protein